VSTQLAQPSLDERPATADSRTACPQMTHTYHLRCNGGGVPKPGAVAICGWTKQTPPGGHHGQPDCVVCSDLKRRAHCGNCGGTVL
jgi:hypothetical protein